MKEDKEVNQDPNSCLIYLTDYGLIDIKKVVIVGKLYQQGRLRTTDPVDSNWYYVIEFNEKWSIRISEKEITRKSFLNKWVKFI